MNSTPNKKGNKAELSITSPARQTSGHSVSEVLSPKLQYDSDDSSNSNFQTTTERNIYRSGYDSPVLGGSRTKSDHDVKCAACGLKLNHKYCHLCGDEYGRGGPGQCANCGPVLSVPMRFCLACGHDLSVCTLEPKMLNPLDPTWDTIHAQVLESTSVQGDQKRVVQGYLNKVGRHFKQLTTRWFSIEDNFLYEYHEPLSARPSHVHYLEGCFIEAVNHSSKDPKLQFGFEILFSEETKANRFLYARSEKEQLKWIKALRTIAHNYAIEEFYEIGEKVGVGRFGTVYKAVSKATNQTVAVKIIDKNGLEDEDKESIRSEIAVLKLLSHKYIVNLINVFESRSAMNLVMDFVVGGDVAHYLQKNGPLSEAECRKAIYETLKGLSYLHSSGIVHRDIKPENLMLKGVDFSDSIVIGDFGHSRFTSPMEILRMPCGTLAFIAPEVLDLRGYGKSVDVWSLGVTMYQMLTGLLPFYSEERRTLMDLIVKSKPSFDGDEWKNISPDAIDLVSKMLTNDARKRISIDEALGHAWFERLRSATGKKRGSKNSIDFTPISPPQLK